MAIYLAPRLLVGSCERPVPDTYEVQGLALALKRVYRRAMSPWSEGLSSAEVLFGRGHLALLFTFHPPSHKATWISIVSVASAESLRIQRIRLAPDFPWVFGERSARVRSFLPLYPGRR